MADTLIHAAELHAQLEDCVVIDCRFELGDDRAGRAAYETAHIPSARYASLNADLSGVVVTGQTGRHPLPVPKAFAQTLGRLGVEPGRRVVAYDADAGAFAARLWWMLGWVGHEARAVLDGGLAAYQAAGYALSSDPEPDAGVGPYPVRLQADWVVDADGAALAGAEPERRLFDARDPERYRGEHEPIDPVAGHLPGAGNLPWKENLVEGRFRSAQELRRRFDVALGHVAPQDSVVYCGSGVTACHNLLAAEHAGLSGMRLYAGSFSDWVTDPSRAVERSST